MSTSEETTIAPSVDRLRLAVATKLRETLGTMSPADVHALAARLNCRPEARQSTYQAVIEELALRVPPAVSEDVDHE